MKVVLFCGGQGMRMRDYAENIPKPMINIGYRPILWHIMKYYAHYGHKEFILCLGYRGDAIKQYFLNYEECLSNDFTLSAGGKDLHLYNSDIQDWEITFAETGMSSNIGQRLSAVAKYLQDQEVFLASYSDGLTDLHLPNLIDDFTKRGKMASFISVKPNLSYHLVRADRDGIVREMKTLMASNIRINGGYFVLRRGVLDYIQDGDDLVGKPFGRLIEEKQLIAYDYDGFFASMDTFKEKQELDDMYANGNAPWVIWKNTLKKEEEVIEPAFKSRSGVRARIEQPASRPSRFSSN